MISINQHSLRVKDGIYNAVVEIRKGSKGKTIFTDETMSELKEVKRMAKKYPYSYGSFPNTLAEDGDHLDVLIVNGKKYKQLEVVAVEPVGMVKSIDQKGQDNKVICVPAGSKHKIKEKEIMKFLTTYKGKDDLTKWDNTFYGKDYAKCEIENAHNRFKIQLGSTVY